MALQRDGYILWSTSNESKQARSFLSIFSFCMFFFSSFDLSIFPTSTQLKQFFFKWKLITIYIWIRQTVEELTISRHEPNDHNWNIKYLKMGRIWMIFFSHQIRMCVEVKNVVHSLLWIIFELNVAQFASQFGHPPTWWKYDFEEDVKKTNTLTKRWPNETLWKFYLSK